MPHPSNTRQKLPLPGVTTSRGRYPLGGRFGPPGQLLKKSKNLALTIIRPSHTVRTGLPIMIGDSDVMARRMLDGEPTIVAGDGHTPWTLTRSVDFAVPFVGLFGKDAASEEFGVSWG
jgi:hypothetical protein